jgi:hypothetical protein
LEFGEEVDPQGGFNGYTNPLSRWSNNTAGMILVTDNPRLGARAGIPHGIQEYAYNHSLEFDGAHLHCWGSTPHWNPADEVNNPFWAANRPKAATPNLFAHELHHALVGYVHRPFAADPPYTPAVQTSTPDWPRGFNMRLAGTGVFDTSVDQQCRIATSHHAVY